MQEWKNIYESGLLYICLHIYMHIQKCLYIHMASNIERGGVWGGCFHLFLFLSKDWCRVRGMVTKITWVNFSWGFLLKDIVNGLRHLIHYQSSKECWCHCLDWWRASNASCQVYPTICHLSTYHPCPTCIIIETWYHIPHYSFPLAHGWSSTVLVNANLIGYEGLLHYLLLDFLELWQVFPVIQSTCLSALQLLIFCFKLLSVSAKWGEYSSPFYLDDL